MQMRRMKLKEKVFLNKYGFYELKNKPKIRDMQEEFEKEYYQNNKGNYENIYDATEKEFFDCKFEQKLMIIEKNLNAGYERSILDIGCGEGYLLNFFYKKGFEVLGIDFSRYGIVNNNPEMMNYFLQGNCEQILEDLIKQGQKYTIINMDQSLDMMRNPFRVLKLCRNLLSDSGILVVKVANNYSILQEYLLEKGKVDTEYWLDEEGHPYYFNKDGLCEFLKEVGFKCTNIYGESFIDFNMLNDRTNYYKDRSVGKDCYRARLDLELLMDSLSREKTLQIFQLLGEMGLGREIIGTFVKEDVK